MTPGAHKRVVVVGANLAGLVSAHRLEAEGLDVCVVEAAGSVGASLREETLGDAPYEPALQTLPALAPQLEHLLLDLGLADTVRFEPLRRVAVAWRGKLRPLDLRRVSRFAPAPGVPPWEAHRLRKLHVLADWFGEQVSGSAPEQSTRLDDRSVADFARLYLGRRAHTRLLQPLFETHFGLDTDRTTRVLLMLLADERGSPALKLAHGMAGLPKRLAAGLSNVRTGVSVASIRPDGLGVVTREGDRIDADCVLVAVGPGDVVGLVPTLSPFEEMFFRRAEPSHTPGRAQRLVLAVQTRARLDLGADAVWIPADGRGHLAGVARAPATSSTGDAEACPLLLIGRPELARLDDPGDERSTEEALLRGAATIFPDFRKNVAQTRLHRLPLPGLSFDVGCYRAVTRLRAEQATQAKRRPIFFCGNYQIAPHTEGAITAGNRAADEILQAISPAERP